MASANDSINDLLRPNHVLFGVNSFGRILRLDADTKTAGLGRGVGAIQSTQGWKVSIFILPWSVWQFSCMSILGAPLIQYYTYRSI